tara:strand:+ start:140 stop:331 length:192 start_codon:yes stop_codon:yes gene_type:complete
MKRQEGELPELFWSAKGGLTPWAKTRQYVNGHPTNGFASAGDIYWYRDPGCAGGPLFFAKKAG